MIEKIINEAFDSLESNTPAPEGPVNLSLRGRITASAGETIPASAF